MSQQSSQTSALEWKPTPQPPKQEFPGLAHASSKDPHSGNNPYNKPGLPERTNTATATNSTGITGPPAESKTSGRDSSVDFWIWERGRRMGPATESLLSPSMGWPHLHVGPRSKAQLCCQVSGDLSQTLHLTTTTRRQIDSSQESSAIRNEVDYRLPVGILAGQMSPYVFARCAEGTSGAMLFIKDSRNKHTRNLWTRHKSAVGHEILCHVTQSMLLPQHLLPVPMFFFVTPTHCPLVLTEKKSFQKRQSLRTEIFSHLLPPKKHPLQSYESTNRVSGLDKRH